MRTFTCRSIFLYGSYTPFQRCTNGEPEKMGVACVGTSMGVSRSLLSLSWGALICLQGGGAVLATGGGSGRDSAAPGSQSSVKRTVEYSLNDEILYFLHSPTPLLLHSLSYPPLNLFFSSPTEFFFCFFFLSPLFLQGPFLHTVSHSHNHMISLSPVPAFSCTCLIRHGNFKLLRSPWIDSKESIPPVYVAWAWIF